VLWVGVVGLWELMDEATVSETAQTNELASQAESSDNYTLIAKRSSLRDKFTDHKT